MLLTNGDAQGSTAWPSTCRGEMLMCYHHYSSLSDDSVNSQGQEPRGKLLIWEDRCQLHRRAPAASTLLILLSQTLRQSALEYLGSHSSVQMSISRGQVEGCDLDSRTTWSVKYTAALRACGGFKMSTSSFILLPLKGGAEFFSCTQAELGESLLSE